MIRAVFTVCCAYMHWYTGLVDDDSKAVFTACIAVANRINTLISTGKISSGTLQHYMHYKHRLQ
jgi:hypothetical protein